jgi:phage tail sheath gpL-like
MTIPNNILVPFVAVEINNTGAQQGPVTVPYQGLLIAQKTSDGSAADNSVVLCSSPVDAAAKCGRGSMGHLMAKKWFDVNQFTPLYLGVLADNGSGAAAAGSIAFTGPATENGTLSLYVGGQLVQVAVTNGMIATALATALVAAIPSTSDLPVTAAVDGTHAYQVNLTYKHKGEVGNQCDLRLNYQDGEKLPAGLAATIVPMSSGTSNPVLTTLITNLLDRWLNIWANPFKDSTSLTALETELESRFGPTRQIDAMMFTCDNDTYANMITLGNARNEKSSCIVPTQNSPSQPCEYAAQIAGQVALEGQADPSKPLQTVTLPTVLAPALADQFSQFPQRNTLLANGIGTTAVGPGGVVQIERLVTTYQKNAAGSPDTSYRKVESLLTLMELRYQWRTRIRNRYPRAKLAADGTRFGPGQSVITPQIAKSEAIMWFREMESDRGLVQKFDDFKAAVTVSIDSGNPDRLLVLLPPTLIGQFIVCNTELNFVL